MRPIRAQVLVVDDEPAILSSLRHALAAEGYGVDVAGNVQLADERLRQKSYELAVLDVQLPDGNGIDLLQRLRSVAPDTSVIMVSGHATIDTAVRATKLGAIGFLEKPVHTDALLCALETALRLQRAEAEAKTLRRSTGMGTQLVGQTPEVRALLQQIERAARSHASVMVTGERGTGKELVARALHALSPRSKGPLEKLNCAAVPAELIESELFGHEAGAFTGATKQRRGKFERASGGTLFLDEVGDMPLAMQAKLLRVLQERELERVGGHEVISVDVRIVAATNKDLEAACEGGMFRADLFDRLNVVPLHVPPLRQRRDDIPLLAAHFLETIAIANDRPGAHFTSDALQVLAAYPFPGNVRELRNVVERLVILATGDAFTAYDVRTCLPSKRPSAGEGPRVSGYRPQVPFRVLVEEAERAILEEALRDHEGRMAQAARALGMERSHLYKKAKSLGLRPSPSDGPPDTDDDAT